MEPKPAFSPDNSLEARQARKAYLAIRAIQGPYDYFGDIGGGVFYPEFDRVESKPDPPPATTVLDSSVV